MNILVTGGAGYIGAHIVDLLCDKGYGVIVFDNLSSGFKENLNKNSNFILGDICNNNDLEKLFKKNKIDTIIHMAAYKSVGNSMSNISSYTDNNVIGSLNLIHFAIKYKIKKFIFSSSAAVYGIPSFTPINEEHTLSPVNHYGFTKLYVENYLKWMSLNEKIKFVSLRYFNAAGYTKKYDLIKFKEKFPENLLPIIMEVANNTRASLNVYGCDYNTNDGTCIRDYVHVVDLADAHIKALKYLDKNKSLFVNLSSGIGYSVLDIIKITEKIIGNKINYKFADRRAGDPDILLSNNVLAKQELNWVAKFSNIENIISSMWQIYKK
jgi:UDP-glucose 4-epimerase